MQQEEDQLFRLFRVFAPVVDQSGISYMITDVNGEIVYVNQAFEEMTGYRAEEVIGRSPSFLQSGEHDAAFYHDLWQTILSGKVYRGILKNRHRDGSLLICEKIIAPITNERDEIEWFISTDRDLTERIRLEEELRSSRERLAMVIDRAPLGIAVASEDGVIQEANAAFSRLVGLPPDELPGTHLSRFTHPEDIEEEMVLVRALSRGEIPSYSLEKRYIKQGDEPLWVRVHVARLPDVPGQRPLLIGMAEDISVRKKAEEAILHQAFHDPLTGLPNRSLLLDRLYSAISRARRTQELVAVLFLDLDRFKSINDTLGHTIGDRLLKRTADRLLTSLREYDTVSRTGGDEFVLLLPGLSDGEQIMHTVERIIELMAEPFEIEGHELHIPTSIGVAVFPQDGADAETLIKNADVALYRAKEMGRNCFVFYNPDQNVYSHERLLLENEMRRALRENQFQLFFQPQIDLATGSLAGFESLARWNHPQKGMISPGLFIPIAEETGMILPLGATVLRDAFATVARWREQGKEAFKLSVNISGRQFYQKNFLSDVMDLRDRYRIPPHSIELEITESIAMQMTPSTMDVLLQLRKEGFLISLDDFGTGYSSLKYLQEFPLDCLKIDRSFIEHIDTDRRQRGLLASIVGMAKSLELTVVAEGVETEGQLSVLTDLGCDRIQGYYYSPPVPEHQALEFFSRTT